MVKNSNEHLPPPDGIHQGHIETRQGLRRHASILSLAVLGAVLAAGLSGYAGEKRIGLAVDNAAGQFRLEAPSIVRNGNIIETRVRVVAKRRIGKLVIGIEPGLWRQITTNSTTPDAANESFADGLFRFAFDKLDPGKVFEFQINQQVNPNLIGANRGRVVFLDGNDVLAQIPVAMRVLP